VKQHMVACNKKVPNDWKKVFSLQSVKSPFFGNGMALSHNHQRKGI